MDYQRKELQILGGGFNMLPPGDKIPITDYLLAQNWRPDRVGKLTARYGWVRKFALAGPAFAHSAAVYGGVSGAYYLGCNDSGGSGEVYYNLTGPAIATGFDGDRIGMVPLNGWMWMANSAKTGKHNSVDGFCPWLITAPASAPTCATGSANASGPNGTYEYYVTYVTSDGEEETNPGPASSPITVSAHNVNLTSVPTSADARVGSRNIYATGGGLGQAYLVATIADNVTTSVTVSVSDSTATNDGQVMPTDHDQPPSGAAGLVGPYFGRLITWVGNRLFWTDPGVPQYWPGSADAAVGNWVDVGMDGENIQWCTLHQNVLVIYKERTVWRLVGDPDTGSLEIMIEGVGLVSSLALTQAGAVDYFAGPNGLYRNNLDRIEPIGAEVVPMFQSVTQNTDSLTPPGSIGPGPSYYSSSLDCYGVALGYAMGKLYVSAYAERTSSLSGSCLLLVYDERTGRWFYDRQGIATYVGFQGFIFDGVQMVGLTGDGTSNAYGYNLDDFSACYTEDHGSTGIEVVYQSHYEDAGLPDNQKMWLEVVVDIECGNSSVTVYAGYDNGNTALSSIGTVSGAARQSKSFALGTDGVLARNISVGIKATSHQGIVLHNVYLYYYVEARLAKSVACRPTDFGATVVKQAKELLLDIDTTNGAVGVNLSSDLPGNAMAVRQALTAAQVTGRGVVKIPFTTAEGYLWQLALTAVAGAFRLYRARLLMRPIGVYVEAYEAAAGFVWDSMEMNFEAGITHLSKEYSTILAGAPIKRARAIRLDIDTFNASVTYDLWSDLPGNAQASRQTGSINSGSGGRRFLTIMLPTGTSSPIEGRAFRLRLSGTHKFVLYDAAIEILPVGVYIEAYEAAAAAVYDSRELDFGTPVPKEARELELDIETTGTVTVQVLSDISSTFSTTISTTGREKKLIPMTLDAATESFQEGRMLRLIVSGSSAFRLYGARFKVRPFGQYLLASEMQLGALWDTGGLDLGTQRVKQVRAIELDLWAYGSGAINLYSDLPGNAMALRNTTSLSTTTTRTKVQIVLPQGTVPDNYLYGRLLRATITGTTAVKLFGARIHARPIGVYVETYEAAGGAVWDSTPTDLGSPQVKTIDQIRFDLDTDGAASVAVYTDLPGEGFALRGTYSITSASSARHWATIPVSAEARSVRLVVSSLYGFRLYKVQIRASRIGRYLASSTDALNTLDYDFSSERVKAFKKIEVDLYSGASVTYSVLTNQTGAMSSVASGTLSSTSSRKTLQITLPPAVRGRLFRLSLTGGPARVYHVRVWTRPLNEPDAPWAWQDFPVEESEVLPQFIDLPIDETPQQFTWSDLPVPPTAPEWAWADLPVAPTKEQPFWAKVLSVEETPEKWDWVDVPVEYRG